MGRSEKEIVRQSTSATTNSVVPTVKATRSRDRFDLRVGEWGLHINARTGKFEIFRASRPDLAHLTIMWGTRSGDLDVHLTRNHERSSSGSPKDWESLFTVPLHALQAAGVHLNEAAERIMVPQILRAHRKFRPGWLARRGYIVTVTSGRTLSQWLTSLAPRARGKYRLDLRRILEPGTYPPEMVDNIFDPRVLHLLEEHDRRVPVQATRVLHGRVVVEDGIILHKTMGPDGTWGWWGMKHRDSQAMMNKMMSFVFDKLVPLVRPAHAEKWEQIVAGLGMEDFEESRTIAESIRRFLRDPGRAVGKQLRGSSRVRTSTIAVRETTVRHASARFEP